MNTAEWNCKDPNLLWCSVRDNKRDVQKATVKCKLMTGTYLTQSLQSKYSKNITDATCPLCKSDVEDYEHFLLNCKGTELVRSAHRSELLDFLKKNKINNVTQNFQNEETILQILIDCTVIVGKKARYVAQLERICREWIYAVHLERARILLTVE